MLIKVKVFPNSKKPAVDKKSADSLDVRVKSKPRRGEANRELMALLAAYFRLPANKIRIIRGRRQRNKLIKVDLQLKLAV